MAVRSRFRGSGRCGDRSRRLQCERLEERRMLSLTHLYTFNDGLANDWIGSAHGTLFNGADQLLGPWAKALRIEVVHFDSPMLLAMLPPGAFIGLGMLLAGKYLIDQKMKQRAARQLDAAAAAPQGETGKAV